MVGVGVVDVEVLVEVVVVEADVVGVVGVVVGVVVVGVVEVVSVVSVVSVVGVDVNVVARETRAWWWRRLRCGRDWSQPWTE